MELKTLNKESQLHHVEDQIINIFKNGSSIPCSETATMVDELLQAYPEQSKFSSESVQAKFDHSLSSLYTIRSKRRSVSFSDKVDYVSKSYSHFSSYRKKEYSDMPKSMFGKKETVYMTLFKDFCRHRTSGTQATASINKCLQVSHSNAINNYFVNDPISNYSSTCNTSTIPYSDCPKQVVQDNKVKYSDVYFFGKKRDHNEGMGGTSKMKKHQKQPQKVTAAQVQNDPVNLSTASVQAQSPNNTTAAQTKRTSNGSNNAKLVSIKDTKPCPSTPGDTKGDMVATVSHIRIGPRDPCPVHGMQPCQGPRCIVAASGADEQAPVKVSTMTNPRRGVFELVIRRMNGAPLARNELMLEWTPPPSRPCGSPCGSPCGPMGPFCRPSKCKMIVCRPTPCRPPRCCKKACKKPCGPMPCRPVPCRPVPCRPVPCKRCCKTPCCGKSCQPCKPCVPPPRCRPACVPPRCRPCIPKRCRPCPPPRCNPCAPPVCSPCSPPSCCPTPRCRPCPPPRCKPCPPPRCRPCPPPRCKPCPPPRCRPCPPPPCKTPCLPPCGQPPCGASCSSPCTSPCKSSPCLRPCPVGYRKLPRKTRSQPKIKAHRKFISPCLNRSKGCPVVRSRSVPGPCITCCSASICPPRKCCSVFPCPSRKYCPVYVCSARKCFPKPCPPAKCCQLPCPPRKCCSVYPCKPVKCCKSSCSTCC